MAAGFRQAPGRSEDTFGGKLCHETGGLIHEPEGMLVKIWVDADACPGEIKELIIRAGRRLRILVVFVANKYISIPDSPYISSVRIGMEPEAVDE